MDKNIDVQINGYKITVIDRTINRNNRTYQGIILDNESELSQDEKEQMKEYICRVLNSVSNIKPLDEKDTVTEIDYRDIFKELDPGDHLRSFKIVNRGE